MSELNLFGQPHTTQQGQRIGGGLARQTRREVEQTAARAEVAAVAEQAHAFVTSVAMTNTAVLINQAETLIRANPASAPFLETLVSGYALGAARRLAGGV